MEYFGFELELSNVIAVVRVAPAHKMYVRSGSGLVHSDLTCIV